MKFFKLMLVLLPLIAISACSTTGSDAGAGSDVAVIDHNVGKDGGSTGGDGAQANGTEATVIADGQQYDSSDLNNPKSPLSKRVVYFDYNSDTVRPEDQPIIAAHASYLASHPNVTVRLQGNTDERGSREYNLALGERRALAIRQVMMLQGASKDQFQVVSFGEERPADDGHNPSAWAKNRRVEIVYLGK